MPGWFESLKAFFNIDMDLSGLKSVSFKLLSDNSGNSIVRVEKKELHVHLGADVLDDPHKRQQVKQILKGVVEDGHPLLEVKAAATVEDIASNHDYEELLVYFKDKIPSSDIPILRAALYMRKQYNAGVHVDNYKQDIVYRYGQRGANIANLCTTGYFESHIRPMYEELRERPNFSPQQFIDSYNMIIEKAPIAVFVSTVMHPDDLLSEVGQKLLTNRAYGIRQLNIHAIGAENVRKVKDLIQNPVITQHYTNEPAVAIEGNIINVQIFF